MEEDGSSNKAATSSVSFTVKKKTTKLKPVQLEHAETKEFVFSLEGRQIESSAPAVKEKTEYVIPLISKTKWRTPKATAGGSLAVKPEASSEQGGKTKKTQEELELEREAVEAVWRDVREAETRREKKEEHTIPLLLRNKPPILEGQKESVLADAELRPEPCTQREYEEMPIEEFGKAMVRGMGWKEGEAIGSTNKGLIEPIEYIGNVPGLGLGAIPKPAAPPKKSDGYKNIRKPGEQPKKVARPYVDKDGRVRHIKRIGEEIPEQPAQGFAVGNYARVVAGRHEDLYGKIVMVDEDTGGVFLKLAINSQVERFGRHHLELVTREEYRLGRPPESLAKPVEEEEEEERDRTPEKKQYGLIRMKDGRIVPSSPPARHMDRGQGSSDHRQRSGKHSSSESTRHEHSDQFPKSKRIRRDDEGERGGTKPHDAQRHRDRSGGLSRGSHREDKGQSREDKGQSREGHREAKVVKRSEHQKVVTNEPSHLRVGGKKEVEPPEEEAWLCRDLVVKVTDRQYKKGRHYNTKVTVLDVLSRRRCVCQTADGHLLEGLEQSMLETVVPKASYSSVIKVVRGERKGELGMVVEQDRERATAVVQLHESKEVLNLDFDDICQYVGTDADEEMM